MQKIIYMNQIAAYADCLAQPVIDYIGDGQIETYESFGRYDLIAFDYYDLQNAESEPAQLLLYIDRDDLMVICENDDAYRAAEKLFTPDPSNERALYLFFKNLLRGSAKQLESMEDRVSELDDDVSDGTETGLREQLIAMRNEILRANKYYEQLSFLFAEICDNDNDLLGADSLKYFEALRNRCVHLRAQAASLREYITQVRESYLAQIGLEQSNLMKVFTLVTSIFLPLTLIAGWYGMNLQMPEFAWKYGYVFVAGLCLVVCGVWFAVFKKKKWFK